MLDKKDEPISSPSKEISNIVHSQIEYLSKIELKEDVKEPEEKILEDEVSEPTKAKADTTNSPTFSIVNSSPRVVNNEDNKDTTNFNQEKPILEVKKVDQQTLNAQVLIDKLFEEDFKRLIKNRGRNINEHYSRIKTLLFEFHDTKAYLEPEWFESILKVSLNLLKQVQIIKFTNDHDGNVASKFCTIIFIAIGASAKITDCSKGNSNFTIKQCKNFSRFFDLMRLGTILPYEVEKEDSLLKNENFHLREIEEEVNSLVKIFSNEFIYLMKNKASNTKNDFELFVNWHLDVYYITKLRNALSSFAELSDPIYYGNKQSIAEKFLKEEEELSILNYTVLFRVVIWTYDILKIYLSDQMKEILTIKLPDGNYKFILNELITLEGLKKNPSAVLLNLGLPLDKNSKNFWLNLKGIIKHNVLKEIDYSILKYLMPITLQENCLNPIKKLSLITDAVQKFHTHSKQLNHQEFPVSLFSFVGQSLFSSSSMEQVSLKEEVRTINQIEFAVKYIKKTLEILHSIDDYNGSDNSDEEVYNTYENFKRNEITARIYQLSLEFYIVCFCDLMNHLLFEEKELFNKYKDIEQGVLKLVKHLNRGREFFIYDYDALVDEVVIIEEMLTSNLVISTDNLRKQEERDSPYCVRLEKDYGPLKKGFEWQVPQLGILIGKNGIGKTSLVELLKENYNFQIAITANHLQEIDDAFNHTIININDSDYKNEKLKVREICHQINNHGTFLLPDNDGNKQRFPIIELLHAQFTNLSNEELSNEGFSVCNELKAMFNQYKFDFSIEGLGGDENHKFQLYFNKNQKRISFANLSSGEKVLFTLISCAVVNKIVKNVLGFDLPKLMLFDEMDIHFHPEYTKKFFEIIKDHFSDNDTHIVMTTHNPATISLSEGSNAKIYIMEQDENNKTIINPAPSRRHAISVLSDGMLTVVKDDKYVIVEAEEDVKFYNIVYQKFLATSFLKSNNTQLLFVSTGIKLTINEKYKKELEELYFSFDKVLGEAKNLPTSVDDNWQRVGKAIETTKNKITSLRKYKDEEFFAGCDQVKQRVQIERYEGKYDIKGKVLKDGNLKKVKEKHIPEIIWSLTDKDKGDKEKKSSGTMRALKDVYSIENYLCMPLNLFYFIKYNDEQAIEQKKNWFIEIEESLSDSSLQKLLQQVADFIVDYLKEKIANLSKVPNSKIVFDVEKLNSKTSMTLINDLIVEIPTVFFQTRGHDLQGYIDQLIFGNQNNRRMNTRIIKTLEEIPASLLPKSLLETMEDLVWSRI